jgi:hypothetical protein
LVQENGFGLALSHIVCWGWQMAQQSLALAIEIG